MASSSISQDFSNTSDDVIFSVDFLRIGLAGFFTDPINYCQIGNCKIVLNFKGNDSQLITVTIPYRHLDKFYACFGWNTIFFTIKPELIPDFLQACKFCNHSLMHSSDRRFYERCILIHSSVDISSTQFGQILRAFGSPDKVNCFVMQLTDPAGKDLLNECGAVQTANSKWTFREPCPSEKRYPSCCFPPGDHAETNTSLMRDSNGPSAKRSRLSGQSSSKDTKQNNESDVIIVSDQSVKTHASADPHTSNNLKIRDFYYKPTFCKDGIKIHAKDYERLSSRHAHMCDTVIDFYMMHFTYETMSPADRNRIHVFNSFFYTGLKNAVKECHGSRHEIREMMKWRHARVAKWTKSVDIFSKDFIIIPLNEDDHWALAIICFPWMVGQINYRHLLNRSSSTPNYSINPHPNSKEAIYANKRRKRVESTKETYNIEPMPCILMLDSLIGSFSRVPNVEILRHYLQVEWNERRAATDGALNFDKTTIRGFQPKVPQQPNLHDCGVYVMKFMESFFKKPITSFTKQYFETMSNWFDVYDVTKKREFIRGLIVQKYQESLVTTTGDDKS